MSTVSFSALKSYQNIGPGWMSSRAMAMSASIRWRGLGMVLLLRYRYMHSKEQLRYKAQRVSADVRSTLVRGAPNSGIAAHNKR